MDNGRELIRTREKVRIIVTGTDSESAKGGIGVVMRGYFKALEKAEIPYDCVPTYHPSRLSGKWLPWFKALPRMVRHIRALQRKNLQPVIYSHAGAGFSLFRESFVMWTARLFGAKTMVQIHAPQVDNYLNHKLSGWLFKASLRPADLVCLLTPWWKERLENAGVRNTLCVIPNPLPSDLEEVAKSLLKRKGSSEQNQNSVTVLSMARLVVGKGIDIAIQAMTSLPENVFLIVAGDGDSRMELEKMAQGLKLGNRIRFVGWVSGDEKKRLLEEADIFCLPSTNDAFPISMVEAMAYGVPVVAVKWGGIPDMVADGRAGILVNAPEADKISDSIHRLLDPELRHQMGTEAKRWVLEVSGADHVAERFSEIIQNLCGKVS